MKPGRPPIDVLCVSSGSGMNEMMLMIQMKMNSVATYGNQRE